jgi:hypothetical protein
MAVENPLSYGCAFRESCVNFWKGSKLKTNDRNRQLSLHKDEQRQIEQNSHSKSMVRTNSDDQFTFDFQLSMVNTVQVEIQYLLMLAWQTYSQRET